MTTPSPTTLAIAAALEAALTPIIAALTAPLLKRITDLEDVAHTPYDDTAFQAAVMAAIRDQPSAVVDFLGNEIDKRAPTDDFIEKATSTILNSSQFDEAVLGVMEDRSGEVVDNLNKDLTDKFKETQNDHINNIISKVIRGGQFNIEFTRY